MVPNKTALAFKEVFAKSQDFVKDKCWDIFEKLGSVVRDKKVLDLHDLQLVPTKKIALSGEISLTLIGVSYEGKKNSHL